MSTADTIHTIPQFHFGLLSNGYRGLFSWG